MVRQLEESFDDIFPEDDEGDVDALLEAKVMMLLVVLTVEIHVR